MRLLMCAALLAQPAAATMPAQSTPSPADTRPAIERMRSHDLLLLSLVLNGATLTEALGAYGDPASPMLPVGEISRLLGLDVTIRPAELRIDGRIGPGRSELIVDLRAGLMRVSGVEIAYRPDEVGVSETDIYVSAALIERLLPIRIALDPESLLVSVGGTQPLPVEQRAASDRRIGRLAQGGPDDTVLYVETPYRMISPPAFDVVTEAGYDSRRDLAVRRYDLRGAADVLGMDLTAYLGSDETGAPSTARVTLDKRSPNGDLLGPIGATYFALGDVYTPLMTVGPIATEGRGFAFSTAPLGNASVFQRITLRGELPIGYQAELYVNEVLRGGQRVPTEGRYEFLDVPLSRGLNVLRIVLYGPNGERNELVRVINVGGGLVEKGETTLDLGVVQQTRPVVRLRDRELDDEREGKLRVVVRVAHGLRDDLTLLGSGAIYPDASGKEHGLLSLGASGSLLGASARYEHFEDIGTGSADAVGLAGEIGRVSLTGRHVEYRGDFVDENEVLAGSDRSLQRTTSVDGTFALAVARDLRIPVSVHAERAQFADGGESWAALSRASAILLDTLFSLGLDYSRERFAEGSALSRLSGDLAASRAMHGWQLRGVVDYDLAPQRRVREFLVTADRAIVEDVGLHLGASRRFGPDSDVGVQGGVYLHLPFGELALTGDYQIESNEFRLGLRIGLGLVSDPDDGHIRMTPPGVASGGSAVVSAFIDANGNERRDEGEEPVSGVRIAGGERMVTTDTHGRAFVTGLGNGVSARLIAGTNLIDAFYVSPPPSNIELAPRPGAVASIVYPFRPASEVIATLWLARSDGTRTGLAAVKLRLVRDGARPIEAISQFDGSVVFDAASPGLYRLELDPEEASRLDMRLVGVPQVIVDADGSAPPIDIDVIFGGRT